MIKKKNQVKFTQIEQFSGTRCSHSAVSFSSSKFSSSRRNLEAASSPTWHHLCSASMEPSLMDSPSKWKCAACHLSLNIRLLGQYFLPSVVKWCYVISPLPSHASIGCTEVFWLMLSRASVPRREVKAASLGMRLVPEWVSSFSLCRRSMAALVDLNRGTAVKHRIVRHRLGECLRDLDKWENGMFPAYQFSFILLMMSADAIDREERQKHTDGYPGPALLGL